jgi:hypothetical protein
MYYSEKIGRNTQCPCGSGRKFKKCCGVTESKTLNPKRPDVELNLEKPEVELSRDIAYRGKIGRRRRDFCINYIDKKREILFKTKQAQDKRAAVLGKTISCKKGCHYCCSAYVEAWVQECEAIVFYLYENPAILKTFLDKYPKWRQSVKDNGDLYRLLKPFWFDNPPGDIQTKKQIDKQTKRYYEQQIECPFLDDGVCSIYEVRPYSCAALFAFTPSDYCRPDRTAEADALRAVPLEVTSDYSFYYGKIEEHISLFMPMAVYGILKLGVCYFSRSGIPGLENLENEFNNDPEVISSL